MEKGNTILDPFCGSGTTGCAAVLESYNFIGIEREKEYIPIIQGRCEWAKHQYKIENIYIPAAAVQCASYTHSHDDF